PRVQPFAPVGNACMLTWRLKLLGKHHRVSSQIKAFRRHHAGGLMVPMILSRNVSGHPGQNYLWPSKPDDSHHLFQRRAMAYRFQGMQNVLGRRVLTAQKPDVRDSENGERMPGFHLPHIRKRLALLHAHSVWTGISARSENYSNALMLVKRSLREIRRDSGVIVRMGNDQQDICLVATIRRWDGRLNLRAKLHATENKQSKHRQPLILKHPHASSPHSAAWRTGTEKTRAQRFASLRPLPSTSYGLYVSPLHGLAMR